MRTLIIDFEVVNTEWPNILQDAGQEVMARHPATEILCMCAAWADDGKPLLTWVPGTYEECTQQLDDLAADPEVMFEAHNAAFEKMFWRHQMVPRFGFIDIPDERWSCSMAAAYVKGYPGALADLLLALELPARKDTEGRKLTLSLRHKMPLKVWNERRPDWATKKEWDAEYRRLKRDNPQELYDRSDETMQRVIQYCQSDCYNEHLVHNALGEISEYERRVWLLDQRINQRGILTDRRVCENIIATLERYESQVIGKFQRQTGLDSPDQVAKLLAWAQERGWPYDHLKKEAVQKVIDHVEAGTVPRSWRLSPDLHEVLQARLVLGSKSTKKFGRMLASRGAGGRSRFTLQYHGAHTGRWGGRLFQPQNLLRDPIPKFSPDQAVSLFDDRDPDWVREGCGLNAITAAGRCSRHAIVAAPGWRFLSADFAGIEFRITLGLAGEWDHCEMLRQSDAGEKPVDIYFDMAEQIYRQPKGTWNVPNKAKLKENKELFLAQRQIGKNTILGCGFGMGHAKFRERYCPEQPESFAKEVVRVYRKEWAPKVPKLWAGLERAAVEAVAYTGQPGFHSSGFAGFVFQMEGKFLVVDLPDGQRMWYRDARLERLWDVADARWGFFVNLDGEMRRFDYSWDEQEIAEQEAADALRLGYDVYKAAIEYRTDIDTWVQTYGGALTENLVQKLARGLLVEALYRVEAAGYIPVLTVHDEILVEMPHGQGSLDEFMRIMSLQDDLPKWVRDFHVPIAVEGWEGSRYRK